LLTPKNKPTPICEKGDKVNMHKGTPKFGKRWVVGAWQYLWAYHNVTDGRTDEPTDRQMDRTAKTISSYVYE